MQYQKAKLLTAEEKSFYQTVIGQWGYMNNPRSQGDIIGIYDGRTIKGNFGNTKSKTIDFKVNLFRDTFSGSIYIRQHPISISNEADIQAAVVVVPIYGATVFLMDISLPSGPRVFVSHLSLAHLMKYMMVGSLVISYNTIFFSSESLIFASLQYISLKLF